MRLAIVLSVMVAPAFAQDIDDDSVAAMTSAIENAGCVITADNDDAVMSASGLERDQTFAVIERMYEAGMVALDADGTMKLTSGGCP